METIAIYFLKSCLLLVLFYGAYMLFLRRETFFRSNRWYLIGGLIASIVLPMITFTRKILVEPRIIEPQQWVMLPTDAVEMHAVPTSIDYYQLIAVGYITGALIFLLFFIADLLALHRLLKGKEYRDVHGFRFIDTNEKVSPFSYFRYIVFNSAMYSKAELANILEHEKVHSSGFHTLDVLLMRVLCIVFWFNPIIWLYRKCVVQNLEFIADSEASKRIDDIRSYQLTLLKITTHESCVAVTNHFYQSLIKKRIVMLNKNQSRKRNSWKYAVILPALVAFMLLFQVRVIAQEKESDTVAADKKVEVRVLREPRSEVVVDKRTSDTELKAFAERMKQEGVSLKFSKVKRNNTGEITRIKAEFKDKNGKKGTTMVDGDEPIKPLTFYKSENTIGFGAPRMRVIRGHSADVSDDHFAYSFDTDDIIANIPDISRIIDLKDIPGIPGHPDFHELEKLGHSKVFINGSDHEEPIIIVDGKVLSGDLSDEELEKFKSDRIRVIVDSKKIAREALERAQESMDKAGPEMENARIKMRENIEKARGDRDIHQRASREEMERAKVEIERARDEIAKAREEIKKAREELGRERTQTRK